jgi:hypothetical protein
MEKKQEAVRFGELSLLLLVHVASMDFEISVHFCTKLIVD